jgi:hypothetical protein
MSVCSRWFFVLLSAQVVSNTTCGSAAQYLVCVVDLGLGIDWESRLAPTLMLALRCVS